MKRWIAVVPMAALAGCATSAQPPAAVPVAKDVAQPNTPSGGAAADGLPVVSERGIGGTGSPAERLAERGIGGTGIVGVITGFGSVWVDGLEVQYDASSKVDVDGVAASPSVLHIGDVVAIRAAGPRTSPMAQSISVRHELIGRIEALALDTNILTVAGQPVAILSSTAGADKFGLGDWVSASGLRRADGVLVATRLDPAPEGQLSAHGQVARENGVSKVGNLVLPANTAVEPGQFVTVAGTYAAGHGHVAAVRADALPADPGGYFGADFKHLVVQGFVRVTRSTVRLNGVEVNAGPGLPGPHDGLAVVSMERRADGSLAAVGLRYTDDHSQPKHKTPGSTMSAPVTPMHVGGAALSPVAGQSSGAAPTATSVAVVPSPAPAVPSSPPIVPTPTPVVALPPPPRVIVSPPALPTPAPTLTLPTLTLPTPTVTTVPAATPTMMPPATPTPTPAGPNGTSTGSGPVIAQGTGIPVASNDGPTRGSPIAKAYTPVKGSSVATIPQPIAQLQSGMTATSPSTALRSGVTIMGTVRKVIMVHPAGLKLR